MTRFLSLTAVVFASLLSAKSAVAQPNSGSRFGIGQRFVWKNVSIVEKRNTATEWVYQIRINGQWTDVATAGSRDMLFQQVWFLSEHGQLPQGDASRSFERLKDANWHFDSEYDSQQAALARKNQIEQSSNLEARIRTVIRSKSREELSQVPNDYKVEVPGKPEPWINGPNPVNSQLDNMQFDNADQFRNEFTPSRNAPNSSKSTLRRSLFRQR